MFVDACRAHLTAITAAKERSDLVRLGEEAHSLKGAALNLSARRLADAALALERAAREGRASDARIACSAVSSEAEALFRALQPASSTTAA